MGPRKSLNHHQKSMRPCSNNKSFITTRDEMSSLEKKTSYHHMLVQPTVLQNKTCSLFCTVHRSTTPCSPTTHLKSTVSLLLPLSFEDNTTGSSDSSSDGGETFTSEVLIAVVSTVASAVVLGAAKVCWVRRPQASPLPQYPNASAVCQEPVS